MDIEEALEMEAADRATGPDGPDEWCQECEKGYNIAPLTAHARGEHDIEAIRADF